MEQRLCASQLVWLDHHLDGATIFDFVNQVGAITHFEHGVCAIKEIDAPGLAKGIANGALYFAEFWHVAAGGIFKAINPRPRYVVWQGDSVICYDAGNRWRWRRHDFCDINLTNLVKRIIIDLLYAEIAGFGSRWE